MSNMNIFTFLPSGEKLPAAWNMVTASVQKWLTRREPQGINVDQVGYRNILNLSQRSQDLRESLFVQTELWWNNWARNPELF